jgi:glucosamine--fructose-6-phosphate aminotransferase (isomerizing)
MSLMLDEIEQQPEALERTFDAEIEHFRAFRRRMEKKRPALVVLVARGTSDNAALFARYLIETVVGVPVSLAAPSVMTIYGAEVRWQDAIVVGISQSGESTDTNLVLEKARAHGVLTVGITNEAGSAMTRAVDEVFLVRARRERSVAATKTYTGQLLMGYLLAYALGAPFPPSAIQRLAAAAAQALKLKQQIEELSERYRYMANAVVVGRGLNYANAFEFSLKLMETCYVVAERFSGADFIHGPIALVERAFPVFAFAAPGPTFAGNREMLERLNQLGAETIVISEAAEAKLLPPSTRSIRLRAKTPRVAGCPEDLLTPIPYIVPGQLFAAYLAEQKGFNPDQPRTLSKVTKTI